MWLAMIKKIYAYDKEGKIMTGWDFEGTKSEVTTPIQHFRIKGKGLYCI
ncbi:MAG: hypothetical protein MZV63_26825 [Marinilabiliales bacterium]|nr:hypothetical protein [Marinilabiliales bacterium]